ncbi:reticulon-like protein B17 [Iris pallida]|uniref:Reticulon-like protein B17 n=1 Tax=Iris pallida TaxID=29817 RepID=A0AAX6DP05_IRIPA|nr:reticulon-like protein B17 [Iris pallida]
MDPPPPPPPLFPQKKKGKSKAIDDDGDLDDDEKENPMEIVQGEETNPRKSSTDQQQEEQQQRKKSSSTVPRGRGRRNNAARRPRRQRLDKDDDFLPLFKQQQQQLEEGEEKGRGHEIVISRKRKKTNHSDTTRPRSPSPSSNKTIVGDESESMNSSVWELISDIVMWKNVTKSTFWFGLGSTFFISSSFSRESNFSIISAASHIGILILGFAFFHDSLSNRQTKRLKRTSFQLTEDDFLQVARLVLPLANSILAKSQEIFSGEPLMTLKASGTHSSLHSQVWSANNPMETFCNWLLLELHYPQTLLFLL